MPISKLTLNLSVQEVSDMIKESLKGNFDGYTIKTLSFNMTDEGFDRNQSYGHKFTGVDIILERATKYGGFEK